MVTVSTMARSSSSRDISFDTDFGSGPYPLGRSARDAVPGGRGIIRGRHVGPHIPGVRVHAAHGRCRVLAVGSPRIVSARSTWAARRARWPARGPRRARQSRHVAVEVDRLLAEQVREHFPIPKAPQVKIRVGDGRAVLDGTREGSFDVIVRDAFASGVTPDHLRTVRVRRPGTRAPSPPRGCTWSIARTEALPTRARTWLPCRRSSPSWPPSRTRRWAEADAAATWLPWRAQSGVVDVDRDRSGAAHAGSPGPHHAAAAT